MAKTAHECKSFQIDHDLTVREGKTLRMFARCTECGSIDPVPEVVEPDNSIDRTDPGYWLDNF